jgi:hypothetical protein
MQGADTLALSHHGDTRESFITGTNATLQQALPCTSYKKL